MATPGSDVGDGSVPRTSSAYSTACRIIVGHDGYHPTVRPIGYYVHHRGSGHAERFAKISSQYETEMVAISELAIPNGLRLPSDVPANPVDPTAGGALHWAPVDDPALGRRSRIIGDWIVSRRPRGVVVDVSVEMTLLCRLFGVATVVVRQHGDRTDAAHEIAYRSARRLLAPFPRALEHPTTPSWIVDRTEYSGFVMRDRSSAGPVRREVPGPEDAVILWGTGGGQLGREDLDALLDAVAPHRVWCLGPCDIAGVERSSLVVCGWVDDVDTMLAARPVVVASAGNNTVADVARVGAPLVVVAQQRPFDEQVRHAEGLERAGAAAVVTAGSSEATWRRAIGDARRRRRTLSGLASREGAVEAARIIADALPSNVGIESGSR